MDNQTIITQIIEKAQVIFLKPTSQFEYEPIITGCKVKNRQGRTKKMYAIAPNTWRAFERIDKASLGASEDFKNYLVFNKKMIISKLKEIKSIEQLDDFENILYNEIKSILSGKVVPKKLSSYNRIRKPIDLFIEHIVCMCSDLESYRLELIPLLFIPLDSQIFSSSYIFSTKQLQDCNVRRKSSFGDLLNIDDYRKLQDILYNKAIDHSKVNNKNFYRIYYDLLWNNRFCNNGENLFETNLG
ncbi:hypothetical protein Ccar_24235 [Clostridium carboxidivorans P7]|uniref:Putative cytoplasmic protein n=1 Tax=Clostridium carboxidivorans P7 TaxID=536227 RepID=C6Q106_9CLOT|nr:hypothetical protein [Clostridium carboxidivorans]AKN33764.1 hypothetical protein Ccar_24235 [Clostridium carboxidivorans P7]EET84825.1 putative cytoplasmic protein [Clostridium carboxidivorans P7]EFG86630.1 hypothetical protein CLCAR_3580 [Clostridium carboxidivorans P7]